MRSRVALGVLDPTPFSDGPGLVEVRACTTSDLRRRVPDDPVARQQLGRLRVRGKLGCRCLDPGAGRHFDSTAPPTKATRDLDHRLLLADLGRSHEYRRAVAGLNDHPALLDRCRCRYSRESGIGISVLRQRQEQPTLYGTRRRRDLQANDRFRGAPPGLFVLRACGKRAPPTQGRPPAVPAATFDVSFNSPGLGGGTQPALCYFASGVEPGYNSLWIVLTSAALVQSAPPIRTCLTSPTRLTTPAAGPAAAC